MYEGNRWLENNIIKFLSNIYPTQFTFLFITQLTYRRFHLSTRSQVHSAPSPSRSVSRLNFLLRQVRFPGAKLRDQYRTSQTRRPPNAKCNARIVLENWISIQLLCFGNGMSK